MIHTVKLEVLSEEGTAVDWLKANEITTHTHCVVIPYLHNTY